MPEVTGWTAGPRPYRSPAKARTIAAHRRSTRRTTLRRPTRCTPTSPARRSSFTWYVTAADVTPTLAASWPTQKGPASRATSIRKRVGSATAAVEARKVARFTSDQFQLNG